MDKDNKYTMQTDTTAKTNVDMDEYDPSTESHLVILLEYLLSQRKNHILRAKAIEAFMKLALPESDFYQQKKQDWSKVTIIREVPLTTFNLKLGERASTSNSPVRIDLLISDLTKPIVLGVEAKLHSKLKEHQIEKYRDALSSNYPKIKTDVLAITLVKNHDFACNYIDWISLLNTMKQIYNNFMHDKIEETIKCLENRKSLIAQNVPSEYLSKTLGIVANGIIKLLSNYKADFYNKDNDALDKHALSLRIKCKRKIIGLRINKRGTVRIRWKSRDNYNGPILAYISTSIPEGQLALEIVRAARIASHHFEIEQDMDIHSYNKYVNDHICKWEKEQVEYRNTLYHSGRLFGHDDDD